jgi:uncharacterized coiled-coil protein SlyX
MSADSEEDPKVLAWRMSALEKKVDAQTATLEEVKEILLSKACPAPGACVPLVERTAKIEETIEEHGEMIRDFQLSFAKATGSLKTITAIAGASGSVIGLLVSVIAQAFFR